MGLRENIVSFMEEKVYKPMSKEELAQEFGLEGKETKAFYKVLKDMEKEGTIIKTRNELYGLVDKMNLVVGTVDANEKGFGFLVPEDKTREDIYIPIEDMNGAFHGDRVVVRLKTSALPGLRDEGEIIRIIERVNETLVGTFESSKNFGFVVPDNTKIPYDIFIPKADINGAKTNQKVVVKITEWPEKKT